MTFPDAAVQITGNRMGWCSTSPHEINTAFAEFAGTCTHPVLDIGAGIGVATIAALTKGASVIANDLDLSHLRSLEVTVPVRMRCRLETLCGHFPTELNFPDRSLGAIHSCNVIHFLAPSELEAGIKKIFRWLVPKGKVFIMARSPYQSDLTAFVSVFEQRKRAGLRWPGQIEDIAQYSSHPTLQYYPKSITVFDAEVLSAAFVAEGFVPEVAKEYSRKGIPEELRYDGRENVMLIAHKKEST
jgi:SAM-dependent methyltransferase